MNARDRHSDERPSHEHDPPGLRGAPVTTTHRHQHRPPEVARYPDPTAARLRHDLPALRAASDSAPTDQRAMAMFANALTRGSSCQTCVFRDMDGTCRAWPPRPLNDGRPIWPRVSPDDWCALGSAW